MTSLSLTFIESSSDFFFSVSTSSGVNRDFSMRCGGQCHVLVPYVITCRCMAYYTVPSSPDVSSASDRLENYKYTSTSTLLFLLFFPFFLPSYYRRCSGDPPVVSQQCWLWIWPLSAPYRHRSLPEAPKKVMLELGLVVSPMVVHQCHAAFHLAVSANRLLSPPAANRT